MVALKQVSLSTLLRLLFSFSLIYRDFCPSHFCLFLNILARCRCRWHRCKLEWKPMRVHNLIKIDQNISFFCYFLWRNVSKSMNKSNKQTLRPSLQNRGGWTVAKFSFMIYSGASIQDGMQHFPSHELEAHCTKLLSNLARSHFFL